MNLALGNAEGGLSIGCTLSGTYLTVLWLWNLFILATIRELESYFNCSVRTIMAVKLASKFLQPSWNINAKICKFLAQALDSLATNSCKFRARYLHMQGIWPFSCYAIANTLHYVQESCKVTLQVMCIISCKVVNFRKFARNLQVKCTFSCTYKINPLASYLNKILVRNMQDDCNILASLLYVISWRRHDLAESV